MYAASEQRIIARLQDRMPEGVHVGTLEDLERVPEMRQKAPAAWVIYDGYTVGDRLPSAPGIVQLRQNWFVVLAARSARGNGATTAAKAEVDTQADADLGALLGFHLGGGNYLQVEEAPGPEYDAGYCYLPLAFSNAATFKGQP